MKLRKLTVFYDDLNIWRRNADDYGF